MVTCVEGVYRNGNVDFLEPANFQEGDRLLVTRLPAPKMIDLRERGIDEAQAAVLRAKFSAIAEDWDRPEMDIYDAL